ncbi:DUF1648 domain-containing protein [Actinotalea sp. K2]|uniref:DUF1648 domain-containing protein n=1 Tax=Actinotalea sp. K2 TaxID=2939438 RepID=UPI002016BDDC|nr:DUF1648 domain-containing protein [Actinotalea sp. K2]MCL3859670.1 DUF1648 domain-containing protein [Actinotalea sp. K2]
MSTRTHPTPPRTSRGTVPHRGTTTVLTLGVPAVVVLVAVAVALSWRDDLPDPVAVHWGSDGVDGYGSLTGHLVGLTALTVVLCGFLWLVGFLGGRDSLTRRLAAGISVWSAVFFAVTFVGTLAPQRGLTDAAETGSTSGVLLAGLVAASLLGALAARLVPADRPQPTTAPVPPGAPTVPLAATEQATWVREAAPDGARWFGIGVAVLMAGIAVLSRQWGVVAVLALVLALLVVMLGPWTVTVDRDGLAVRSLLRRPRVLVPLEEVLEAEVVEVRPVHEFGGWGLRTGNGGRSGVVLRRGPGLQVRRTGGRVFVVTVDDAPTGAALLNTLAARARHQDDASPR